MDPEGIASGGCGASGKVMQGCTAGAADAIRQGLTPASWRPFKTEGKIQGRRTLQPQVHAGPARAVSSNTVPTVTVKTGSWNYWPLAEQSHATALDRRDPNPCRRNAGKRERMSHRVGLPSGDGPLRPWHRWP